MERRDFLRLAFGVTVGTAALAVSAQAAPLSPQPATAHLQQPNTDVHPAVTSAEEAAQLKPEQVRWHRRGWGRPHRWHRRHWRRW